MKCMFPFNSLLSAYVVDIFLLYALESYLEHTHINPEQAICVHFPNSWRTNVLNARVHYRVHSAVAVCSGSQLFVWNSNVLQERWGKWALDFTVIKTFISHILHTCKTSKCYNTYLKDKVAPHHTDVVILTEKTCRKPLIYCIWHALSHDFLSLTHACDQVTYFHSDRLWSTEEIAPKRDSVISGDISQKIGLCNHTVFARG